MTVKRACVPSRLLHPPSHPTGQATGRPLMVALGCWSLVVLGFPSWLELEYVYASSLAPPLPPTPHTILLSLFRTCLEVVRFVSLWHKAFIITSSLEGMTKEEGTLRFRVSGLYSWKVEVQAAGGCWCADKFSLSLVSCARYSEGQFTAVSPTGVSI